MGDFTHLHVHSHYSLLDGLGKIDGLLDTAKELGMDSLALTDHGVMYGVVEFVKKAKEAGIKPIVGMEAYLAPKGRKNKRARIDTSPRHLTILAQNNAGYKNLVKLSSKAFLEGYYYKPRIDYEILEEFNEGLIILSGCMNGDIAKAILERREEDAESLIKWHKEIFGPDRFYLEVQHHATIEEQKQINAALIKYAKKFNLPLVATTDAHYLRKEDAEAQDVLICVQTQKTVNQTDRLSMLGEDFSLKSQEKMKESWKHIPEAIENTQKIVEMCNVELEFGVNKLPHFPLPTGQTADSALRVMCEENLKIRYRDDLKEEAKQRLNYELEVISKTGFAAYFLIVADFVNEAKRRGILVGPGRGSAAGSIVSYLTNITGLDPLEYNLLFERFLNPERVSMPDIDLDFADDRRDEVIEYVRQKYGSEHVAQIITFGTMAARAAVRDAGRALGIPYVFCDKVAKAIPLFTKFKEALGQASELKEMYDNDPQAKKLIDTARKLEGVCRHASTHAAGVVVTEEPLVEHVPLQLATTNKEETMAITQYAMTDVEALGLLKIDFLGLKNLTIIKKAMEVIKERHGVEIDIDNLPLDDQAAYKLLQDGKTTGVFQLESAGMKRYLKELKPTEFEDIISMAALYRPGPMDSIPDFIAAKHGRKKITYLHPTLKPILEKTYGVIVTQDQVLQMAREFAGFSYAEADILRKAVGKKIKKLLDEQREKFIQGAMNTSQVNRKLAKQVWDFIEPFARYGFNRCLTGDTWLHNPTTGEKVRIIDLYRGKKVLDHTWSLNKHYKIFQNTILKVTGNGKKPVFEVSTRTGRKIRATANHPFLTEDGWTWLDDLTQGTRIAVPRRLPEPEDVIEARDHELAVLGYILAEGNLCHPSGFYFYSRSQEEIADYVHYLEQFKNTVGRIDTSKSAWAVYTKRRDKTKTSQAVEWLDKLGLRYKKATNKIFPEFVWRLSNRQLALLIAKLWQGDGCINTDRLDPNIYYATSSKLLVEQLQELLLRFGILSTIHNKRFRYRGGIKYGFTLSVSHHENIRKFLKMFAEHFVGQKKIAAVRILATHPILNGSLKPGAARGSKDVIPVSLVQMQLRESALALNMPFKQAAANFSISERFFHVDKKKIGFLRETAVSLATKFNNDTLRDLSVSDIYWDEVVSIEPLGEEMTYDLTMDTEHNFIANNIVVHNSHAACYAMIAFQTAYLKAHYPAEFMASLLTSDEGNVDRQAIEVAEALSMEIPVLPPDVNESGHDFTVVDDEEGKQSIRFGLEAIKNVGAPSVEAIVAEREARGPYKDLLDLFRRVKSKDFNRKSVESLVKAGALDEVAERNQVLVNLDRLLEFNRALHRKMDLGQKGLFGAGTKLAEPRIQLEETSAATKDEKLQWEKDLMGLYLTEHPLTEMQKDLNDIAWPLGELKQAGGMGKSIRVAGLITKLTRIVTRNQQPMAFAKLEDLTGSVEVVVFPKILETTNEHWIDGAKLLVEGKMNEKDGELKILADKVWVITTATLPALKAQLKPLSRSMPTPVPKLNEASRLTLQLSTQLNKERLMALKDLLAKLRAEDGEGLKVYLAIRQNGGSATIDTGFEVKRSEETIAAIKNVVGEPRLGYKN